jgi:hypothetical protein
MASCTNQACWIERSRSTISFFLIYRDRTNNRARYACKRTRFGYLKAAIERGAGRRLQT